MIKQKTLTLLLLLGLGFLSLSAQDVEQYIQGKSTQLSKSADVELSAAQAYYQASQFSVRTRAYQVGFLVMQQSAGIARATAVESLLERATQEESALITSYWAICLNLPRRILALMLKPVLKVCCVVRSNMHIFIPTCA